MGALAGIYSRARKPNLKSKLISMLSSQSHRDGNAPTIYEDRTCAIGMINRHDAIFIRNGCNLSPTAVPGQGIVGIHAFIDGVILDIPQHVHAFEKKGAPISSWHCSTILAHAYDTWGLTFMQHLEGEFACAIWDEANQNLILARDPYGKKPLHYHLSDKGLVFASEIKGILSAGVAPAIDLVSLSDFLSLNCFPYPATIFQNISQVPPGCILIYDGQSIRIQRYWYHEIHVDQSISIEQAVEELGQSIRSSVSRRLIGREVYCFLSGGIDSSAIVSYAAELSPQPVHAISVGFAEQEFNELEDAALMARHVGAIHHPMIASPDSFLDMLDQLVWHHDAPFTDTSAYPTYYAAKQAHEFTDIILGGDGPDQILCGSGHLVFAEENKLFEAKNSLYRHALRLAGLTAGRFAGDPTPAFFSRLQRRLYRESLSPVHAAYDLRSYFPDIVKHYVCTGDLWEVHLAHDPYRHPESWFREAHGLDTVNQYLFADMKFYMPDDLMIKVDRMCMAHGLETLSPFLDRTVAAVANKLPGAYKLNRIPEGTWSTKHILREVIRRRLPDDLLTKKKQGFGIPLDAWLRHDKGTYLRDVLLDPRTLNRGYFKKQAIDKMLNVFLENRGDYYFPPVNGLVALLTLELWHRRYVDK